MRSLQSQPHDNTLGICITAYNRRDTTLRCLSSLKSDALPQNFTVTIYLLDDASTDGTADAVASSHPDVIILHGNGQLYWGGGMRAAMARALHDQHDFYLWLNDDIHLFPRAIGNAIQTYEKVAASRKGTPIIVGATRGRAGTTTYSGMRRFGLNPIGFRKIEPHPSEPMKCDTANGNFVLIPAAVANAIGNIDPQFTHRMGDVDYMLRARKRGHETWICPGYVAECEANIKSAEWQTNAIPLSKRVSQLLSPLGLPPAEWLKYGWRHGGIIGIVAALFNYRWLLFPRSVK